MFASQSLLLLLITNHYLTFAAERYAPSISSARSMTAFPNAVANTTSRNYLANYPSSGHNYQTGGGHLTVAGGDRTARWHRANQRRQNSTGRQQPHYRSASRLCGGFKCLGARVFVTVLMTSWYLV